MFNVNDIIRMYKKCNIKMHNFLHSFCYIFNRIWRYNMKELNKLKRELLIMKTENIKMIILVFILTFINIYVI